MPAHRALFHLNEGGRLRVETVLRAIGALLELPTTTPVAVEVVVTGEGLLAVLQSANPNRDTVTRLAGLGVRFLVCADSARQLGLAHEAFLTPVEFVLSGISALVWKRAAGWVRMWP